MQRWRSFTATTEEATRDPTIWRQQHEDTRSLKLEAGVADWRVRETDVKKAVNGAGQSTPSPEGVPYRAWEAMGDLGIATLFEAARALEMGAEEATSNSDKFNRALMICLPSKSDAKLSDVMPIYEGVSTRPFSGANTDIRLISHAHRFRWEHSEEALRQEDPSGGR